MLEASNEFPHSSASSSGFAETTSEVRNSDPIKARAMERTLNAVDKSDMGVVRDDPKASTLAAGAATAMYALLTYLSNRGKTS